MLPSIVKSAAQGSFAATPGQSISSNAAHPSHCSRENASTGTPSQDGTLPGSDLISLQSSGINCLLSQDAAVQNLATFLSRRELLNLSSINKRWRLKSFALPELREKFFRKLEEFINEAATREQQEGERSIFSLMHLNRAPQEENLTRAVMALSAQIKRKIHPDWQIDIMTRFMRNMPMKMPGVFMLVFQDLCRFRPAAALDFLFFEVPPEDQGARINAVYGHRTPLMVAAANGKAELLQRMLAITDVDPNLAIERARSTQRSRPSQARSVHYTALVHAAEAGNKPAMLTLLAHGVIATRPGQRHVLSALDYALQSGDDRFFETVYKYYLSQNRTAPGEPLLKYCRDTLAKYRLPETPFIAKQTAQAEHHMQQLGSLLKPSRAELTVDGKPLTTQELFLRNRTTALPLLDNILEHSWMLTRHHVEQVICAISWLDTPTLARCAAHRQVIHGLVGRFPQSDEGCIWIQAAKAGANNILDWLRRQVERKGQAELLISLLNHRRGRDQMRVLEHALHAHQFDTVAHFRQWGGTLVASSPQALETSLRCAKDAGQETLYQALIEANEHAEFGGMAPLLWSAMLSDMTLFEKFLQRSGPPAEHALQGVLRLAVGNGNFKLFCRLREFAPDIANKYTVGFMRAVIQRNQRDQLKTMLGLGEHEASWLSPEQLNQPDKKGRTLIALYLEKIRANQLALAKDPILNAMVAQGAEVFSAGSIDRNGVHQMLAERGYFRKEAPLFTPPKPGHQEKIQILSGKAQRSGLYLQPPQPSVIGQDFFQSSETLQKIRLSTSLS